MEQKTVSSCSHFLYKLSTDQVFSKTISIKKKGGCDFPFDADHAAACTYTSVELLVLGIFDNDVMFHSLAIDILNLALYAGSSKQGNARLASVGWNCVAANHLSPKRNSNRAITSHLNVERN